MTTSTTPPGLSRWVEWCRASAPLSTCPTRATPAALGGGATAGVTMYGMRASTEYRWRAVAQDTTGTTYSPWSGTTKPHVTTDALPEDLSGMALDVTGTPSSVANVVFNFGCDLDASGTDYIVVADAQGNIVWYQDPRDHLGLASEEEASIHALSIARPVKHFLVIVDHQYVLEYALDGTLVNALCRDPDGASPWSCESSVLTADGGFAEYVHHDVVKHDGLLYALSAENLDPTNTTCGGSRPWPVVVDGVIAVDPTTGSKEVDWDLSDLYAGEGGGYDFASEADSCTPCNSAYWWTGPELLRGCDVAHLNSLWADADDQWTLSSKSWSRVIGVDMDEASSTYGDATFEWYGDQTGGTATATSSETSDLFISDQHGVMWQDPLSTPYGAMGMLLFDNHTAYWSAATTRAVQVDWTDYGTSGEIDIVGEFIMASDATASASALECNTGGSTIDITASGDVVVYCSDHPSGGQHPIFNEFTDTNTISWAMDISCDTVTRTKPSYRGYAFSF